MWWDKYKLPLLLGIFLFAFFTRFFRLSFPQEYIFDEVYHAHTAKLMAVNDKRAFEWGHGEIEPNCAVDWLHPPIAKYTQALGMRLFGFNAFGWRVSSAFFGVLLIALVFKFTELLFSDSRISLLSSFLLSLDGLLLVQSRIAMNDVHVTFFIVLALYLYWKWKSLAVIGQRSSVSNWRNIVEIGIVTGLAMGTKWSGIFALMTIILWELASFVVKELQRKDAVNQRKNLRSFLTTTITISSLSFITYISSYALMFLQGKDLAYLMELHNQTLQYQFTLDATHSYQSRPLQWFLNTKPVWIWVNYGEQSRSDIYAQGNPVLFPLIVGGALLTAHEMGRRLRSILARKSKIENRKSKIALVFLFTAYLMVWLPWQLSPRIMFFYHYLPGVALGSILLAYWLVHFYEKYRRVVQGLILATIFVFILFYPHWTGMNMPLWIKDTIYFALPSWK